ncbi:MAG: hypothetical protein M9962_13780 [Oligoflexia bacterium]|nr:hypothetical protein [Oligoflexia bacterium]
MKKIILLLFIGLFSTNAFATGCFWYEKIELGKDLQSNKLEGEFTCTVLAQPNWYACVFHTVDSTRTKLRAFSLLQKDLPPVGKVVSISVSSVSAMQWFDCDGSDPMPDFNSNGIYQFFFYKGIKYSSFTKKNEIREESLQ